MKNGKFNWITACAILASLVSSALQAAGNDVPIEAYGVSGGALLVGLRMGNIANASGIKTIFKSKTFWMAIIIILCSIAGGFGIVVPEWVIGILSSAGVTFYTIAQKNIQQ